MSLGMLNIFMISNKGKIEEISFISVKLTKGMF